MSITQGSASKPTVVLVHGAFAGSSSWSGVITLLLNDGYPRDRGREPAWKSIPTGLSDTHADRLNADLLAFLKS